MTEGISLTIPFYNEERLLEQTLNETWSFLRTLHRPFELLLGDDGSTDSSGEIARRFAAAHPQECKLFRNPRNRGRGSILTLTFQEAAMPIVAYLDADLEIGLVHVNELLAQFDNPRVQICTGSKMIAAQPGIRARHRKIASIVFNAMVRTVLHSQLSDHQCGLKGFRREVLRVLLPELREEGWAWDTEVLLLAQKRGYPVTEFPVETWSRRKSTVSFVATTLMFVRKIFEFRRRGLRL